MISSKAIRCPEISGKIESADEQNSAYALKKRLKYGILESDGRMMRAIAVYKYKCGLRRLNVMFSRPGSLDGA